MGAALSLKWKLELFSIGVSFSLTEEILVISRCCFEEDG